MNRQFGFYMKHKTAMKRVGFSFSPQLMAEIGNILRFTHKGVITAFASVNSGVNLCAKKCSSFIM